MHSHAHVATAHAARYMTQLAKHWSHKLPVTFDERTARIELSVGVCVMAVQPGGLDVDLDAADSEGLARLERVVAEHIVRFAFREPDLAFDWTRAQA